MPTMLERRALKYGQSFAFIDRGHSTSDRALVRYNEPTNENDTPQLEIVGPPDGDMFGAHTVHDLMCGWVPGCKEIVDNKGLVATLEQLGGLEEKEFFRPFSVEIGRKKELIPQPFTVTISAKASWRDIPHGRDQFLISVPSEIMQEKLSAWARDAVEQDERWLRQLKVKTCGIILTGGGNKCRTMKERLQQVTTRLFAQNVLPSDLEDAVARGALMRYPQNVADELPFGYFYLGQIQPLDWKLHQDICRSAIWKLDRRERKMKGVPQPGLISSYENGEYMTKHRLKPLVFRTKNGLGAEQSIQSFCVHMTFPVDLHYEYAIDLLIYFAETKQKDNSAAHDKLGRLRHGIKEPIREFVNVDIDWGYWQDRFTHYESEGSTWLDIEGIVEGEITDAGFRIHVTLLEPGEQVQMLPATGQPDAHADYRVLHQLTSEIWSPHRSHQISDNVTRKRVRPTRKRAIGKLPAHVPNKRPVGSTHLPTPATSDNQSSVEPDSTTVDRQASTQMRSSRASASAAVPGNHADDILNRTSPSSPRPSIIKEADHTLGCHARSAQSKTSPGPSRKRQRKATARTSSVCMECATAKRKCIATDTPGVGKCRHCDAQNFDCTHNNRPSSVRPCDRCAKHNRPCNARDETGNLRCFNCARRRNRCTFGRKGSPQREQFDTSRGQDLPQRAADALNLLEPFPSEEAPSGSNIVVARPKPGFKEIRWGIVNVLEEQSAPISSAEIRKILHSRLHMNVYAGDVLRVVQELENEGLLERRQDRSIKLRSIGGRAVVQEAIDAANELLSDDSCSI